MRLAGNDKEQIEIMKNDHSRIFIIATNNRRYCMMGKHLEERTNESFITIDNEEILTPEILGKYNPRYIFFPHWSDIIPENVYDNYECVIFHMTDLPFGRGGTPLQNLISRGIYETKISAFRCVKELDAGPVYLKKPLFLQGSAEDIYLRAGDIIEDMVIEIIKYNPTPIPQTGRPVIFKRRKPRESEIRDITSMDNLYDHIRMLDAEGYPRAFLKIGNFKYELNRAKLEGGKIIANVEITPVENEQ